MNRSEDALHMKLTLQKRLVEDFDDIIEFAAAKLHKRWIPGKGWEVHPIVKLLVDRHEAEHAKYLRWLDKEGIS